MWCLAVAFLLAAAVPVAGAGGASPRPQAWAAADIPLPTISVLPNGSRVYSIPLTAGVTYRLVLTGTVTADDGMGFTTEYDANGESSVGNSILRVYYEGAEPVVNPFFWSLNPSTPHPPRDPSHRYEETFTAARSSRLEARVVPTNTNVLVYRGNFTLELFGPGPSPPTGTSGGGPPVAQTSPKLLAAATAWGQAGAATALEPGGEAIATSPPIARDQRSASVTLSGDVSGETAVVIGTPTRSRPREKLTGGDCVRYALGRVQGIQKVHDLTRIRGAVKLPRDADALAADVNLYFAWFMIACLDLLKQQDKQATPAALTRAVGAARSSCGLGTASLSVRVDRAANRISYRSRRASRRGPSRRLRVSCRRAANGAVAVRVRTRSRRTTLRKVLGKRLVVGLYRQRSASGTANVQTTFKRR